MARLLVVLSALTSLLGAYAAPCVEFDSDFNLYVFGLSGGDIGLGQQDSWASNPNSTALPAQGRPPFDGANTQCFLDQFDNAIYVLDGDSANPTDVHVYNVGSQEWSTQKTTAPSGLDPTNVVAILDHDTNVMFGMSGGELFQLDLSTVGPKAQSSAIAWEDVGTPPWSTTGYKPVMALAQNHIHFLNVPGAQPGFAYIFVIHFAFFQPDPQQYTGATFPLQHGAATSLFLPSTPQQVQKQFLFIPDDNSQTYLVNVESNTTTSFPPPSDTSAGAVYAAGTSALVQLSPTDNKLSFLPITVGSSSTTAGSWTSIPVTITVGSAPPSNSNSNTTKSQRQSGSIPPTGSQSSASSAPTTTNSGAVSTIRGTSGLLAGVLCLFVGAIMIIV